MNADITARITGTLRLTDAEQFITAVESGPTGRKYGVRVDRIQVRPEPGLGDGYGISINLSGRGWSKDKGLLDVRRESGGMTFEQFVAEVPGFVVPKPLAETGFGGLTEDARRRLIAAVSLLAGRVGEVEDDVREQNGDLGDLHTVVASLNVG